MGETRQPLRAPLGQNAEIAGLDLPLADGFQRWNDRHLFREEGAERRAAALIRHVNHLQLRGMQKHFHCQVDGAQVPRRAVGDLAGVPFDRRNKFIK